MTLRLLQIGKTKEEWLKTALAEYQKRLAAYYPLRIEELPDVSMRQTGNPDLVRQKEAALCLKRIGEDDFLILLDETGELKSSLEFSAFLANLSDRKKVCFLIGGAYGVSNTVKERADRVISLSPLTFTHQMVRLILMEQLYRAVMIQQRRSYHH